MSTIFKNFDFNPIEAKQVTTNYTIPAGRYALAGFRCSQPTKQATSGPSQNAIQLNGSAFFWSDIVSSFTGLTSGSTLLSLPATSRGFLSLNLYISSSGGQANYRLNLDGVSFFFASSLPGEVNIVRDIFINSSISITANVAFNIFLAGAGNVFLQQQNEVRERWLKQGDVLTIPAGFIVTLSEYNLYT